MKKQFLLVVILASLLLGTVVTVATSRLSSVKDSNLSQYCGLNVNRQTGQVIKFNTCAVDTYGFPARYITSGVSSTVINDQSEYSSYSVGYTSISRVRFFADFVLWTVTAAVLIVCLNKITTTKKASRKKK